MPKDTFFNLDCEKRQKIFAAAVQEFSSRRFSEASINQIVKAAEIPRGSFYQYFSGKEDLYFHMMGEINREKLDVAEKALFLDSEADFFEASITKFKHVLDWSRSNPSYHRIGMLMEMDDSEFVRSIRNMASGNLELTKSLLERDKERGFIRPDTDTGLVADMIYALMTSMLKEYYVCGNDEALMNKYKNIMDVLKNGIIKAENQGGESDAETH